MIISGIVTIFLEMVMVLLKVENLMPRNSSMSMNFESPSSGLKSINCPSEMVSLEDETRLLSSKTPSTKSALTSALNSSFPAQLEKHLVYVDIASLCFCSSCHAIAILHDFTAEVKRAVHRITGKILYFCNIVFEH
jgi:hypothetical protein